jgi:site-specific DNA-methyltransferase (adenine-specific)
MKPYYESEGITIYCGDCRDILPSIAPVDCVVADPPYEETDIKWDSLITGWTKLLRLKPSASVWCFGSLKAFMRAQDEWEGWTIAQEVIWEKHNGSGINNDRFRRVHEMIVQFYKGNWSNIYKDPVYTRDATARTIRRRNKPAHWGQIGAGAYKSESGGPRLQRSVIQARSCHGKADHPTQKPLQILAPLISYSCPVGGTVLDPSMGAGSTLVAARDLGRMAIGIEKERPYCALAVKRLGQKTLLFKDAR